MEQIIPLKRNMNTELTQRHKTQVTEL